MNILHLTFTYPDAITPRTTLAIERLIASAEGFAENHCVSLHNGFPRVPAGSTHHADHTIVVAWGPPLRLGLRWFLGRCRRVLEASGLDLTRFDLIHAHCLTREGLLAAALAARLDLPYCLSIRATDFQMLALKPYLHRRYEHILRGAQRIAVIAPWLAERLRESYAAAWDDALEEKLVLLGNVVDGEPRTRTAHNGRYVMPIAINKSQLKRKNVARTLKAIAELSARGQRIELDILGDGSGTARVGAELRRLGLQEQVRLPGHVPHAIMLDRLADYKALLLCSYPETFGLVYLEALNAGIPIVHARNTGVDGMFTDFAVGIAANHKRSDAIAAALMRMEADFGRYKAEVARLQAAGGLRAFNSDRFAARLHNELYGVTAARNAGAMPACS